MSSDFFRHEHYFSLHREMLVFVLYSSVDFCDGAKQTYSSTLTAVDLKFSDMMMPLPWKPSNKLDIERFYTELWEWALRTSNTGEMLVLAQHVLG